MADRPHSPPLRTPPLGELIVTAATDGSRRVVASTDAAAHALG
jgi:hypothetical protein